MKKRSWTAIWTRGLTRNLSTLQRAAVRAGQRAVREALKPKAPARKRAAVLQPPGAKPLLKSRSKMAGQSAEAPVAKKRSPAATAAQGQWLSGVTSGSFGTRRYRLYRPPGAHGRTPLPLLVMLHGCQQSAEAFAASTRMNQVAAREGFLVLYPEQDRMANSQGCWNWFETDSGRAYKEADWIMATIEQVSAQVPVDAARIAVAGLSSGASMAALLATRHPDRFKAVAMHSGIPPGTAHSTLTALRAMRGRRNASPLKTAKGTTFAALPPLLVIHGGADRVVALRNGIAAAQQWADAGGAKAGVARGLQRGRRHASAVRDFKRGGRIVATLVQVEGLGHGWSGGAASEAFSDPLGPDASRMVWAFAARQFRS